jgi:holo-[acyl-carrier protein] synthase
MTIITRSGIDLIEIKRVKASVERHGERFLKRIYTSQELIDCAGHVDSLSARFAAKEAVSKALGCGIGAISWLDVEILRNSEHQPELVLHGAAKVLAKKLKLTHWTVSLSHTHQNAIAMVIASGEG